MRLLLVRDGKDAALPDSHPINSFSPLKKVGILTTLCFSGFLANYSVAAIQVAFGPMGEEFGVSPALIPTSIGYNLLGIAVGPLFWNALSKSLGRRPTYLIGSALFIPCVIWMALCKSFTLFCVARVITGLVSSFSQTVPPSTLADIFVRQVRGSKMSAFGVAVIIAPVVAPFICGLVVDKHSWPVVFWIVLGLAVLQLLMFFFLVPETLWVPEGAEKSIEGVSATKTSQGDHQQEPQELHQPQHDEESLSKAGAEDDQGPVQLSSADADAEKAPFPHLANVLTSVEARTHTGGHCGSAWKPWAEPGRFVKEVLSPIWMVRFLPIILVSIYYGSLFAWSVGVTIVMPIKFAEPPYNFSTIALGAAFLAFGIGALLGKWSGGIVGDKVMMYMEKKKGYVIPEFRLHALLVLFPFMVAGLIIVGVTIEKELHWIAYLIGGAVFFYCVSASTGILQTYVLETYLTRSMDTQAVFVFFKSIWGFAIAYFILNWGEEEGFLVSYGIQAALAAGVGLLLWALLITKGLAIRTAQGMPIGRI